NAATVVTNRVLMHGHSGQIGQTTACIGAPANVTFINEATIAADVSAGTITIRGQPVLNTGQLRAPAGTVRIDGVGGMIGDGSVSGSGHLDLDGSYTNNVALAVSGGTL